MWSFDIEEISNGAYSCLGKRSTGNKVSISCGESEIYRVFEGAFELEVKQGTIPTKALFLVVSGCKPYWDAHYEEKELGSWVVDNPASESSFIYDGRSFMLMLHNVNKELSWQGYFKAGENVNPEFFKKLVFNYV